jgi:hypothetical protein
VAAVFVVDSGFLASPRRSRQVLLDFCSTGGPQIGTLATGSLAAGSPGAFGPGGRLGGLGPLEEEVTFDDEDGAGIGLACGWVGATPGRVCAGLAVTDAAGTALGGPAFAGVGCAGADLPGCARTLRDPWPAFC